jgi:hypothetical protein
MQARPFFQYCPLTLITFVLLFCLAPLYSLASVEPDLFGFHKEKKRSCCSSQQSELEFAALLPDNETYRLAGTYYTLNDNLTATLMFNNKGREAIVATPTFYSLAGSRLQLQPISVPPASYLEVDLGELLAGSSEEFREGNLKISYQGGDYQLGAQIKLVDLQHGLIWAEQLVYPAKFVSSKLENVWWLPAEDANTRLVVTNTSSGVVTAEVRADGTSPAQTGSTQLVLNPWETRVLDIMRDIVGQPNGSLDSKGGILNKS